MKNCVKAVALGNFDGLHKGHLKVIENAVSAAKKHGACAVALVFDKHPMAQLSFARENGVEILFGNPDEEVPGKNIILPSHPSLIKARDEDLDKMRRSLITKAAAGRTPTEADLIFLAEETQTNVDFVRKVLEL